MNYSRQRNLILNYVKSVNIHPTAEKVYEEVRKIDSKISLGTVYRNLCLLADNSDILRIRIADGKDRFDGFTSNHYHARCEKCGKIIDILVDYLEYVDKDIEKKTNLNILSHNIIFNTICENCK